MTVFCRPIMQESFKIKIIHNTLLLFLGIFIVFSGQGVAKASIFGEVFQSFKKLISKDFAQKSEQKSLNSDMEEMAILKPSDAFLVGNASDTINSSQLEEDTLKGSLGQLRTNTEEEIVENDKIQVYEVKENDTLADIANMYGVTKNTIVWANDLKGKSIKSGDILIILPVNGVKHTVKRGETVKSIVKKYKADYKSTLEFNSLTEEDAVAVGDVIIVPEGEMDIDSPAPKKKIDTKKTPKLSSPLISGSGYFTRPVVGAIRTQGIHGHNGVDLASSIGTPVLAAAEGVVLAAKGEGYNGGYGKMIIISHSNGTQTVYGHLNAVYVSTGQTVGKGEQIGELGNTGRSTGPHLHFEVRGGSNPF